MYSNLDISVVVPAYKRPEELKELLISVIQQDVKPAEVVICEDDSDDKLLIKEICTHFSAEFEQFGVELRHVQNPHNLGYDKNLRQCIEISNKSWAFILGNDDLLLPGAVAEVVSFVNNYDVDFVSRSFLRFSDDIDKPIGASSISSKDTVFTSATSSSKMIFRSAGFVGGLVVNVQFCRNISTDIFDGSLYYQIYLASCAFCENGIGYISTPIVGGRADNPPMFGSAAGESVHVPGGYTAKARASMWRGVLDIVKHVQIKYGVGLLADIKDELEVRQSFHIFEMCARGDKEESKHLKEELSKLNLYSHPLPKILYAINIVFGKFSTIFYIAVRKMLQ